MVCLASISFVCLFVCLTKNNVGLSEFSSVLKSFYRIQEKFNAKLNCFINFFIIWSGYKILLACALLWNSLSVKAVDSSFDKLIPMIVARILLKCLDGKFRSNTL